LAIDTAQYDEIVAASQEDLAHAWAAGFLDGEGCFYAYPNNRRSYVALITASQVVREPLDKLHALYGGSVRFQQEKNKTSTWRWTLGARNPLRACIASIHPYLVVKRRQAELLDELAELIVPGRGKGRRDEAHRVAVFEQMQKVDAALREERRRR
jgi:hypothetical protein